MHPSSWFKRKNFELSPLSILSVAIKYLYAVEICSLSFSFDESFYHKWMLNLSDAFSASVEIILWSYPLFCWCGISHWLICTYWTILAFVGTESFSSRDHGVWSFLYIVELGLLIFWWGFRHQYLTEILASNFLFL